MSVIFFHPCQYSIPPPPLCSKGDLAGFIKEFITAFLIVELIVCKFNEFLKAFIGAHDTFPVSAFDLKTEDTCSGLVDKPNPHQKLSTNLWTFFSILCFSIPSALNSPFFPPHLCAAFLSYTSKPCFYFLDYHAHPVLRLFFLNMMTISNTNENVLFCFYICVCVCVFINVKCSV